MAARPDVRRAPYGIGPRETGACFFGPKSLGNETLSGRAMFQMLGVFAKFERSMIRERVMAGLSRAKADGIQLGRRRLVDSDDDKVAAIVAAGATGTGIRRIALELGVGVGTVIRVTGDRSVRSRTRLSHFSLSEIFTRSSNVPRRNSSWASATGAVLNSVNAAFGYCCQTARSSAVMVSHPNLNM
jgi:hypothetical protein